MTSGTCIDKKIIHRFETNSALHYIDGLNNTLHKWFIYILYTLHMV